MKVFIAWSGDSSKLVSQILHEWLPCVLPYVKPWMSEEDIGKGTIWNVELWKNLKKADFGILCLVPENITEHWVIFEAGALSGGRAYDRVSPFLLGIESSDLPVPLRQFQCTHFTKKDVLRLFQRLNKLTINGRLNEKKLQESFRRYWVKLRKKLKAIDLSQTVEDIEEVSQDDGQSAIKKAQLDDVHRNILKTLASSGTRWTRLSYIALLLLKPLPLIDVKVIDLDKMGFVQRGHNNRGQSFCRILEKGVRYSDAEGVI